MCPREAIPEPWRSFLNELDQLGHVDRVGHRGIPATVLLMRKTPQQGAIWHSSEPLGIRGPSRLSKKTQFLVSDRDTVRIRRKTLATTMMALNLDFEPLRQFQEWILADLIGIGRQPSRSVSI
jgi:hypothetical protein